MAIKVSPILTLAVKGNGLLPQYMHKVTVHFEQKSPPRAIKTVIYANGR